ncbi:MAG: roadblock/LC7 domain-containing protein, partial [Armatimonadetes bacterium]|nr:roadblock/LC7 domain-containing protein [Armatimonadota bacterium]NIM24456.1 roadblock/LC7 domain-containing protein [Armatimonadota bacterium]NIM68327.1 roadblock/LC7 domain-containing protein [Armatimonadota bacterium]NIM76731.1 roadblock/LC7 domain-containing protein [Armatimonadota bacterium]NIN06530.1 roadblock/LC7 domain-containing protein [Armatimonadota bacterium]
MTNDETLLIYEEELKQADEVLRALVIESQIKCALIINQDGSLIWQHGETGSLDTTSLAALAAGGFAATKEIARLIGEPGFSILFHQGEKEHVHLNLVGEDALLMLLFDDRTTIGLVRVLAKDASERLLEIFSASSKPLPS